MGRLAIEFNAAIDMLTALENPNDPESFLGVVSASSARRILTSGRERTQWYAIGPSYAARPKSNAAIVVRSRRKMVARPY